MNLVQRSKKILFVLIASGLGISLTFFMLLNQTNAKISIQANDAIACNSPISATSVLTLTGQIISSEFLTPVNEVQVFVTDPISANDKTCLSDSSGHYTITMDATNPYDVAYNPPAGSQLAAQSKTGISGAGLITQDISLEAGYSITGITKRITNGLPVKNVGIYAHNLDTGVGFGLPSSDINGVYTISLKSSSWEITYIPESLSGLGPTRTQTITLTADIVQDAFLPAGVTVYGQVKNLAGEGVSGVSIFARMEDGDQEGKGYGFPDSKPGGWYTGTLPTGTFDIQFLPPIGQGLGSAVITDQMPLTSTHNLPVTLPAGVTLSGTVACTTTLEGVFVFVDPVIDIPGDDMGGWGTFSDSQGKFGLPVVTGTYRIEFKPPPVAQLPTIEITKNIQADTFLLFDFCPLYLPVILKN